MGFFDMFESFEKKLKLYNASVLMGCCTVDGKPVKSKLDMALRISIANGLTEKDITRIMNNSNSIEPFAPNTFKEKVWQMEDIIYVLTGNGTIDDDLYLCNVYATKVGLDEDIVYDLHELMDDCEWDAFFHHRSGYGSLVSHLSEKYSVDS